MNLGLGNLTDLKLALLPVAMQSDTQFDDVLEEIGLGVAKVFEGICNRQFERVEGDVYEFPADCSFCVLPRFPVENLISIEQRDTMADGWQTLTLNDVVINRRDRSGLVEFGYTLGSHLSQVRITYTGGYWFDTEEDFSSEQPSGSTKMAANLKHAWLLQCRHVFEQCDAMGARSLGEQKSEGTPAEIKILPSVQTILTPFIRYA